MKSKSRTHNSARKMSLTLFIVLSVVVNVSWFAFYQWWAESGFALTLMLLGGFAIVNVFTSTLWFYATRG